jgi:hypothetical protein
MRERHEPSPRAKTGPVGRAVRPGCRSAATRRTPPRAFPRRPTVTGYFRPQASTNSANRPRRPLRSGRRSRPGHAGLPDRPRKRVNNMSPVIDPEETLSEGIRSTPRRRPCTTAYRKIRPAATPGQLGARSLHPRLPPDGARREWELTSLLAPGDARRVGTGLGPMDAPGRCPDRRRDRAPTAGCYVGRNCSGPRPSVGDVRDYRPRLT